MVKPPPTNVDRLREAGVIPAEVTLESQQESAINALDPEDVDTVLAVHSQVGTIEIPGDPIYRIFIF
jgi:hypothetical protein